MLHLLRQKICLTSFNNCLFDVVGRYGQAAARRALRENHDLRRNRSLLADLPGRDDEGIAVCQRELAPQRCFDLETRETVFRETRVLVRR